MSTVSYILRNGSTCKVEAKPGATVMETAIHNNIDGIEAECGGCCSCATCHVYVGDDFFDQLTPADDMEEEMLYSTASERKWNSRLSCQIVVTDELDGLEVHMPESQV